MRIASINIQNFKSYREPQKVFFGTTEKYITIIEGQMGHGKSNLLNAFYWCLFGQLWDSDKAILIDSPNPNFDDLFNKGELLAKKEDGTSINLFVEIDFFDDNNNRYTIKRQQNGHIINDNWKFENISKLSLEKIDGNSGEFKLYAADEADGEVQKFFPRSLSNYFLFRGENRAQLVKLQGKEEFQRALQELSKIEMFNRAEIHLSSVLDEFRTELASKASDEIKLKMENLLDQEKAYKNSISKFKAELNNLKLAEQQIKDEYESYSKKIKENQAAFEYQLKKENEEKDISRLRDEIEKLTREKQEELTKRWIAISLKSLFQDVEKKYQQAVSSGQYPPDISQTLIDKILDDLKCICGTHFGKETKIFEKISNLKETSIVDAKLIHEIETLTHEISRSTKLISSYPEKIRLTDKLVNDLLIEIKSKQTIINGFENKIGQIDFSLDELLKKQQEANNELNKTSEKIFELSILVKSKENDLKKVEADLHATEAKLDKSNLPVVKVSLAEKSLAAIRDLKKKFENSIYDDLEKYTQENWEILVYDKLMYDSVKLLRDTMYFEVYDQNNFPCRSSMNTGHSILLVLSFISSLIKIAKQEWEEEFPLILDAPLSEIGESAMPKALLGFGKIFNQIIIILKDGSVTPSIYEEIKNKVAKRYWIEFDKNKQHSKIIDLDK